MKRGFTLVELLVSTTIMLMVLSALISTFITSHRLVQETIAVSEMSLRARSLREKLLFRINRDGGMLSAQKIRIKQDGREVEYDFVNPTELAIDENERFDVDTDQLLYKNWLNNSLSTFRMENVDADKNMFNVVRLKNPTTYKERDVLWVSFALVSESPKIRTKHSFRVPNLKAEK